MAVRSPSSTHQATISYDKRAGVVRWILDGVDVFRVNQVGHHIDRQWMVIDLGGTEQPVSLNQLNCGMGLFTLLDAVQPGSTGLVRLSASADYFHPQVGAPQPLSFVDEHSQDSSRLFGQGAAFWMGSYSVSSTLAP